MGVREQAVQYAQNHGLYLFPTRPNKTPLTTHGFKDATNDQEKIKRSFVHEGRGIGVHPGRSGYVVVDIDVKDGATGEDQWAELGIDFNGPEVLTPSGGRHLWFRKPEGMEFDNTSLDDSIDVRSDGGYVILPESFEYRWDLGWDEECKVCDFHHPSFEKAPVFPDFLVNRLTEQKERAREVVPADQPIPAGSRQETLFAFGMSMRARGATEGAIDYALREMNRDRCTPPLSDRRMRDLLKGVMRANMDYPVGPSLVRVRDRGSGFVPVKWDDLWKADYDTPSWLVPRIAVEGEITNIFAQAGEGKSEFVLYYMVKAALEGTRVLWLDREMSGGMLRERLHDFGYRPDVDLSNLTYVLYPDLPPLDTAEGAEYLTQQMEEHDVVVLDSLSKFVQGEENENTTHTNMHNTTMISLKAAGKSMVIIDHAGKNKSLGARGGSTKKDNVDLQLRMSRSLRGTTLTVDKKRHSWIADYYGFLRDSGPPITYTYIGSDKPKPAIEQVKEMFGDGAEVVD